MSRIGFHRPLRPQRVLAIVFLAALLGTLAAAQMAPQHKAGMLVELDGSTRPTKHQPNKPNKPKKPKKAKS